MENDESRKLSNEEPGGASELTEEQKKKLEAQ